MSGSGGTEFAGGQHVRPMLGLAQVARQAEDMILYPTRNVEGVGTDQSDPQGTALIGHRSSPADRRSEKNGCIMCQSSGWFAIVSAKKSATSCIIATRPSLPRRCTIGSPMMIDMPFLVNWQTAGSRAAPVRRATIAGPAGMVMGCPRQDTGTPVPDRSRSASRQTTRRQYIASMSVARASGSRWETTFSPRLSRKATKAAYSASESFSATVVTGIPLAQAQAPAKSQLPLCGRATTAPGPAWAPRTAG